MAGFDPNEPRDKQNGKWTNGGASHANGVAKVGRDSVHPNVLNVIRKNPNGFSVTPGGQQPSKGFMVAVPGRSRILSASDLKGPNANAIINDYARRNADLLKQPGAHIGGWQDSATKKVHLDVTHNILGQRAAVRAGRSSNQIAIWDVARRREIRTGGTGG